MTWIPTEVVLDGAGAQVCDPLPAGQVWTRCARGCGYRVAAAQLAALGGTCQHRSCAGQLGHTEEGANVFPIAPPTVAGETISQGFA